MSMASSCPSTADISPSERLQGFKRTMMSMAEGLQPDEFAATAARAVTACAGLDLREQAQKLAGDGLLGVIADEEVGGLSLSLDFAVPVIAAAHSGLLAFPLLETVLVGRLLQSSL